MKEGQKSRNKPPGPKTLSQAVSAMLGQLRRMTSHHCDLGVFPAGPGCSGSGSALTRQRITAQQGCPRGHFHAPSATMGRRRLHCRFFM